MTRVQTRTSAASTEAEGASSLVWRGGVGYAPCNALLRVFVLKSESYAMRADIASLKTSIEQSLELLRRRL